MLNGRSAGVLPIAVLLLLSGCGGSDASVGSRTAAEQGSSLTATTAATVTTGTGSESGLGATDAAPGSADPATSEADPSTSIATSTVTSTSTSSTSTSASSTVSSSGSASTSDPETTGDAAGTPTTIEVVVTTAAGQARSSSSGSTTATTRTTTTRRTTTTERRTTTTASTTTERRTTSTVSNRVLIFTRTAGYRHPSISDGVAAMADLARSAGYRVTTSEDPGLFNDRDLAGIAAVVFLSTSGDVLDPSQQSAFERYIEGGGGFVGVHAATDTEYGWPWYGRLVGTWFANHPLVPNNEFVDCHCFTASVVRQASHPSTDHLPAVWRHRDEWYNFRSPLPSSARILLTVDESTYPGGTMGSVHPVTWTQSIGRGRSWYTALGHTPASYRDADFRAHLLGGLTWAAGD